MEESVPSGSPGHDWTLPLGRVVKGIGYDIVSGGASAQDVSWGALGFAWTLSRGRTRLDAPYEIGEGRRVPQTLHAPTEEPSREQPQVPSCA